MIRKLSPLAFGAALSSAALMLSACETTPPPAVAVAPAPVAPPMAIAPRIVELASVYQNYVRTASNISPAFADGASVHSSLRQAVSYEPRQLAAGQIAYAAIVALQDPMFVAAVRRYAVSPTQRAQVRAGLLADPAYAIGIRGSDSAAGLAIAALNGEGSRVRSVGELVKQAAYDVQRQEWSKGRIPAPELRLAEAKSLSIIAARAAPDDVARLNAAALGSTPLGLTPTAVPPPYTQTVTRGLAIAALSALGDGAGEYALQIEELTNVQRGDDCLRMSKLNLYQCLSVARPWYEDVFCMGQHILIDTGQCIAKTAGVLPPVAAPTPLQTPVPVTTATTPAPMALSAEDLAKPAIALERAP